ncbi:uncharacterized protein EKO05_0001059 [Ascochyta rabiei]|nr:uncharacterized protein EKO05_0001059 [Ascochyta rabiei]UPX10397.1 hypothetical protein EKO05_0001059 [Ascochyta rabiei]
MLPSSRYSRRPRRDRLSIDILPEQSLDFEPRSPHLHWLFGESSAIDINSRLVEDTSPEAMEDEPGHSRSYAAIMREVAAWLELDEHDEFSASRREHAESILPAASQLFARLKDSDNPPPHSPNSDDGFDTLIQAIALQLLASCYTFLPASSASQLPLLQQKTDKTLVTALQAHSAHRLSPAAGHHARAPSETSAWPGLYTGPGPEETLAETTSRRRCSAKSSTKAQ